MKKFLFPIMLIILLFLTNPGKGLGLDGIADTPWPMYQHDPQHTGQSPFLGPIQEPELLWVEKISDSLGENGGLSITDDGSILASLAGCLQLFDPNTREIKWTYPYGGNSRSVALVGSDGNLYWGFGTLIVSISPYGAENWAAALDANYVFGSSPTIGTDGNLYFVHDGVWSFVTNGAARWFYPYGTFGASHASPAIGRDGTIYAPGGHDLTAFQSTGGIEWYVDTPFNASDKTPVIGGDTIYVPADDALIAVNSTGTVEWTYQPPEIDDGLNVSHISVAPDSSLRAYVFGFNSSSFVYALDSTGQNLWKTEIFTNTLTGESAYTYHPLTVDRDGNTYFCADNSRCYGIASDGSIMWKYEFPLVDSIIISAGSQPILADDGLFFVADNYHRLYAFADPSLYPLLRTPKDNFSFDLEVGSQPFTLTIPITSTVLPVTYTASITQSDWLTVSITSDTTPSVITLDIDPSLLLAGEYKNTLWVKPKNRIGKWLEISIELHVYNPPDSNVKSVYLPMVINGTPHPNRILYFSKWFTEYQFASIERTGEARNTIKTMTYDPNQIIQVDYSPDGTKVAVTVRLESEYRDKIVVLDALTGDVILDLTNFGNNGSPAWSPDSQSLAFSSNLDGQVEIYTIKLDGNDLTRLTNNQINEGVLHWSPTGDKMAFWANYHTYIMNADGSNLYDLFPEDRLSYPSDWSPDGRYLLVVRRQTWSSRDELWIYDFKTGENQFLAYQVFYTYQARWSPDGSMIGFIGLACETGCSDREVYITDLSGNSVNVTNNPSNYSQLAWSPDSQWLALVERPHSEDADIVVVNSDGSQKFQVTLNIQDDMYPGWLQYPR